MTGEGERDPDQAYYWTPEWQAGEREAEANYAAGEFKTFENVEDLLAWLEETQTP